MEEGQQHDVTTAKAPATERRTYGHSYVQSLFDRIAPHYDFLNHFLSAGLDIRWRRKAIDLLADFEPKTILDVATGTADFALEAARLPVEKITGIDLSPEMLKLARSKVLARNLAQRIELGLGSAESLQFPDGAFDAVTVAFGVRNFTLLEQGLREMCRVLRPGGAVVILEFSKPRVTPFRQLYSFYFTTILPKIGGAISKNPEAYQYLPSTVQEFPDGEAMAELLRSHGFVQPSATPLTFGIATIYIAEKPLSADTRR